MAQLAIKGHPTRSREIVELIEMLGGKSSIDFKCDNPNKFYYVLDGYLCWDYIGPEEINNFTIYTLEDFLEKYPFKVGDFISIPEYESEVRICEMQWDGFEIQYKVYRVDEEEWYTSDELFDYNDNPNKMIKDMDEKDKAKATPEISTLNMSAIDYNNGLVGYEIPAGYEFDTVIDNKVVLKKLKLTYPKTYEKCCEVLMDKTDFQDFGLVLTKISTTRYEENRVSPEPPHISLINNFYKLLICRDAYWKIAGEQMGLDKSWKPDYTDDNVKYIIGVHRDHLDLNATIERNYILIFPTEEVRDAFYDNFKDLIEECKELL